MSGTPRRASIDKSKSPPQSPNSGNGPPSRPSEGFAAPNNGPVSPSSNSQQRKASAASPRVMPLHVNVNNTDTHSQPSSGNLTGTPPDSPSHRRPSLVSPQRKAAKRSVTPQGPPGGRHKRQISFADDFDKPIAEYQVIEPRGKEKTADGATGCCILM